MAERSSKIVGAMLPVLAAITGWLILARPSKSPTERAYRLCGECGLTVPEVDWLIDANKNSTLTREQSLELFHATFEDRRDMELCEPCAEAVVDAATEREP